MPSTNTAIASAVALGDVARGATVAVVAVVVIVGIVFIGALVLLFRRRAGAQPTSSTGLDALRTRANILLVRADEAVSAAADELGFAIAQFGDERTAEFSTAMADARGRLAEAFRLQQALDDAVPESAQRKREWVLQISAHCEAAIALLAGQDRDFSARRSEEADAPARIAELRSRVSAARGRLAGAESVIARLAAEFEPVTLVPVEGAVEDARAHLDSAAETVDDAAGRLSPGGVNTVAGLLQDASESLTRGTARLDAVDRLDRELAAAASALDALVASTRADLGEARAQRDSAPDADSGAAIVRAVADADAALSATATSGRRNPVAALDSLSSAVATLDTVLATARNQAQRLEHARTALIGTLVSANSQVSALRALISAGGRRVGAEARTRLAEAERQLVIAEAEADPVEALDAARRAVTHARDGDALAHYDAMGLR